jgi:enoyl-CoA hydratase/carnithine racemase
MVMPRDISLETTGRIATLTIARPDALNAFTRGTARELVDALDAADADDEVGVVIVTGSGRTFCAGADVSRGSTTFDPAVRDELKSADTFRDGAGIIALRIFEMNKPVIAAVNGPAIGMGATIVLPMDMRLASTTARFGFVFTRRGLVPEAASSWFLPRVVGISTAQEWVCTGRIVSADEALAAGLVRSVHPPGELLDRARELAHEIVANTSPVSVALSRHMLWRMLGASHPMTAHKLDSVALHARGSSEDVREGVTAFLEKRVPNFHSRVSTDMPEFFPWWDEEPFPRGMPGSAP